jgi:hypothetical protein
MRILSDRSLQPRRAARSIARGASMSVSNRWAGLAILFAQGLLGGCGSSPAAPSPTPRVLQVAGQYQITQQQVTDSCGGGGQPATVTGTVTHTAGSNTFSLSDTGGTTFSGSVQNGADFTANGVFGPDSGGQTYTQQLQGRFTTDGFTATLSVHVTPRNCDFIRSWTAAKQGARNVIP